MRVCMHAPRTQSAPQTPRPLCRSTENLSVESPFAGHSRPFLSLETRCTCRSPFRHPHIPSQGHGSCYIDLAFEPTRLASNRRPRKDRPAVGNAPAMPSCTVCAVPVMARRRWWVDCRLSSYASCWHPPESCLDDSRPLIVQDERGCTVA